MRIHQPPYLFRLRPTRDKLKHTSYLFGFGSKHIRVCWKIGCDADKLIFNATPQIKLAGKWTQRGVPNSFRSTDPSPFPHPKRSGVPSHSTNQNQNRKFGKFQLPRVISFEFQTTTLMESAPARVNNARRVFELNTFRI